jgi:cytochrome b
MEGNRAVPPRVWDPVVRITHWTVAVCVLLNFTVVSEHLELHEWVGYVALAMLVLRVIWGIVGSRRARFSSFPPSLAAAREHALSMFSHDRHAHESHNPLGALMVYALWGMLFAVSGTGILLENVGEASLIGRIAEEVHEVTANLLVLMAGLHVAGVLLESKLTGINLIRQMIGGRSR